MKYASKSSVIEAARAAGSRAETFKGAARYLVQAQTPLGQGAPRASAWSRGHAAAQQAHYGRRAARMCARLGLWPRDVAEALADAYNAGLCTTASEALWAKWPYRTAQSKWAGGGNIFTVEIGASKLNQGTTAVWSENGKWRGNDAYWQLSVTPTTIALFPSLMTPDGLAVMEAEKIGIREYRLTWLEQGRGLTLKPVRGFLIRGYHVPGDDMAKAFRLAARGRAKGAATARAARARNAGQPNLRHIWVGEQDSVTGGNCQAGTKTYLRKLQVELGQIGGIRADDLLRRRDDLYTRRAVAAAVQRQKS